MLFLVLALCYVFHTLAEREEMVNWKPAMFAVTGGAVGLYALFYPVLVGIQIPTWYSNNVLGCSELAVLGFKQAAGRLFERFAALCAQVLPAERGQNSHLRAEKCFPPTHMSPGKTDFDLIPAAAAAGTLRGRTPQLFTL